MKENMKERRNKQGFQISARERIKLKASKTNSPERIQKD